MPILCLSQAGQDVFARYVIGRKGTYLDIGSYRPTYHNNSRTLEFEGWTGLSIDYQNYCEEFKQKRNNPFLYGDVTRIDWNATMEAFPFLKGTIDYISFDVDGSTRAAFDLFPFDKVKFGCMTIEHDQYLVGTGLRDYLREKLTALGYVLLCADVVMPDSATDKYGAFEDWWVNPELVDMNRVEAIRSNGITYLEIFKKINPEQYAFYCPPPSYD
jgi:hypothetical protein